MKSENQNTDALQQVECEHCKGKINILKHIKAYLSEQGRKGANKTNEKYSLEQRQKWGRKGGRPKRRVD